MEKIKNLLKKLWSLVRTDGLEHIIVCILLTFALGWIRPMWITALIVLLIGVGKEVRDYFKKRYIMTLDGILNDAAHDLVCDCIGIAVGFLFVFLNLLAR